MEGFWPLQSPGESLPIALCVGGLFARFVIDTHVLGLSSPLCSPVHSVLLSPVAGQRGWHQQRTEALNRVADPLQDDDPIRNPDFREDYLHADGSINE